jgi:sugar porter (SP) family MFS transporter
MSLVTQQCDPNVSDRVVAGLGVGVASVTVPLYVSETAPRAIRGLLTGLYQQFIVTGIMLSFWIDYGSLLHIAGDAQWVIPLALQSMPAFLLFFGMIFCSETPRHLAKQDRWEESKKTLSRIRNLPESHPYVQTEFAEICAQLERERLLSGGGGSFRSLQKEMWTVSGNRKRLLLSVFLMTGQQLTGVNAINYYAPRIFLNLGVSSVNTGLFATGIYGLTKVIACAIFLAFAADSLGRRKSLLWTAIGQGVVMYYIGFYVRFNPPVKGRPVSAPGYVALVCIYLFAVIYQFGWGPVCWIYIAEIPTVRLRSMNVAIAASTQWLFNFVVARATPSMLTKAGKNGYGTYLIFGSFSFLLFVITWFFIPETKGMLSARSFASPHAANGAF